MGTEDRPGGKGGEFVAPVRFVERSVTHAEAVESLQAPVEVTFVGNAADDEMRVGQVLREEAACGFNGRVAGLDDLMWVGQILPHEEVEVRCFKALVEVHGLLLR